MIDRSAAARLKDHTGHSRALATLSDDELTARINANPEAHRGIGGVSSLIDLGSGPVFVKRVPLSAHEMAHPHSTANLHGLPLYFQYGVGSQGFGAWRELAAHQQSSEWVLSGAHKQFPLLHHWRVLPLPPSPPLSAERRREIDADVTYWESSEAVRRRLEGLYEAKFCLVLCLEALPLTLHAWLEERLLQDESAAAAALDLAETGLEQANAFMEGRGFLHFDAHFRNILTDGQRLYLSDFGLALSKDFALAPEERAFWEQHRDYDRRTASLGLAYTVVRVLWGADDWEAKLRGFLSGSGPLLTPRPAEVLRRHGPTALALYSFIRALQSRSKQTPYPRSPLDTV